MFFKILGLFLSILFLFTNCSLAQMDDLAKFLKDHVVVLSRDIGERNFIYYDELERAAGYIREMLESYGYSPKDQEYYLDGRSFRNIIATKVGERAPEEVLIIGAHYDSVVGSPGADDNASAVAALLELARLASTLETDRTIRFIAFTNEEPPHFLTGDMGSMVYTRRAKIEGENILGMVALEMIGYFRDEPNSQSYPPGLSFFYPDTADFIAVCGNFGSRELVRKVREEFKKHSRVDIESLVAPGFFVPAIEFSDNSSFWREGYRAVMITDTAFYRNPYYHSPEDTFEKLDYEKMAEVVKALYHVLIELGKVATP